MIRAPELWGFAISSLSKYSTEVIHKHSATVRRASHAAVAPAGCDGWHADGGASGASIVRCLLFATSSRRSAEVARLLSMAVRRAQLSIKMAHAGMRGVRRHAGSTHFNQY